MTSLNRMDLQYTDALMGILIVTGSMVCNCTRQIKPINLETCSQNCANGTCSMCDSPFFYPGLALIIIVTACSR